MAELTEWGWSEFFARYLVDRDDLTPARVTAEHRSVYRIQTGAAEFSAHISGRLRHTVVSHVDLPTVGDWVLVRATGESDMTIHRVLPRKSKFSRKVADSRTDEQVVAANMDFVWIISSLDQDFSLRRIERYLTLAWESGAKPAIVLTKSDLSDNVESFTNDVEQVAMGIPVHTTSSLTRDGMDGLQHYFRDYATVALLGSSGVGKSTLINALAGSSVQRTFEVRRDGKGRHTTVHRQLLRLPGGGLIIDTPGMRELQLWDGQTGMDDAFGDIDDLAKGCRFSDCRHADEPGCAVLDAVEGGILSETRLSSYHKLQRELAHLERKQDVRAQHEEKKRIKSIMKSWRHHPKYKR